MTISLIIPAYNEESSIGRCLDSVIKNGAGTLKEIIVVDNGSSDRTGEIARGYPGVRVVREERRGTGHARQTGAEHATGDILAYMDSDTTMPADWIEKIQKYFADSRVVFLSGAYRYPGSKYYPAWLLNGLWWVTPPVAWIVGYMGNGGNCAMRADALRKIGGHDRSLSFYGDDTDLARRLHTVGKTIWTLRFYNNTSARRYDDFGLAQVLFEYMLNYWWPVLFHRPYTPGHHYLKEQNGNGGKEATKEQVVG